MRNPTRLALALLLATRALAAADFAPATSATNRLGLELFHLAAAGTPDDNVLLSPYSIQTALAMTYAGADGDTRAEMARVLHFPPDDAPLADSFGALRDALDQSVLNSNAVAEHNQAVVRQNYNDLLRLADGATSRGEKVPPAITQRMAELAARLTPPSELHLANRLYGQTGFAFREPFLALIKNGYAASLETVDFKTGAEPARVRINTWVEQQTHQKIPNLIPAGGVDGDTRLVLVNALYFKMPWKNVFTKGATTDRPFQARGTEPVGVPTMRGKANFGYAKRVGYTAVTLPYLGGDLQFLILLPDDPAGVNELATRITPELLRDCAKLEPNGDIILFLPKFRLEPPAIPLRGSLTVLGLETAFNRTRANFNRMAPPQPDTPLSLADVFHKTYLALDEEGTEAAAATSVAFGVLSLGALAPPEVHVDHPFIFAIQHRESGACLFLGRVTDPR